MITLRTGRKISTFLAWACLPCLLVGLMRVRGAELRAGAAALDITPPIGTPMAGYYSERGAEGVHDPLWAKALVLESDGVKVALVSLDLLGTLRETVEEARRLIEAGSGLPGANVMISGTHSHTGPILSASPREAATGGGHPLARAYAAGLPARIAAAVAEANARLKVARASFGTGWEEGLAFNRRFHMKDGSIGWNPGKLNPNIVRPTGPVDAAVQVIYFEGGGDPIATYVNFAMHLDTVGGTQFSADYPFTLSEALAAAKGRGMVTLFTIGCAGDINHLDVQWADRQRGPGEAARIGTILAANVLRTYASLDTNVASGPLRVSREIVELPLPAVTADEIASASEVAAKVAGRSQPVPKFMEQVHAFKVLDVAAQEGKPQRVEVQVITLGRELAWVSLPGEIFVELGLAIKAGSPFKQTIIAELANGSIGYIPTARAYTEGNYEVVSARCAAGSGELLVQSALRQLRQNFAK